MGTTGQKYIRKCAKCCKEAYNEEDLLLFMKNKANKYGRKNKCTECDNKERRKGGHRFNKTNKARVKRDYNITLEYYNKCMSTSKVCQICGSTDKLCYDHDHATMEFRGVLCERCNYGVGALGDDVIGVRRALSYLVSHYCLKGSADVGETWADTH